MRSQATYDRPQAAAPFLGVYNVMIAHKTFAVFNVTVVTLSIDIGALFPLGLHVVGVANRTLVSPPKNGG